MKKQLEKQTLIKMIIGVALTILALILLAQYISMAQLNNKKSKLDAELQATSSQYQKLNSEYSDIEENYDDYVEDYVRDNYDLVEDGDVLFNK